MEKVISVFDDLRDKVLTYNKESDIDILTKSYKYAYEKHFGQKRLTGEDYINHPLNVAYILTESKADIPTLCAALLHDVLEDCNVSKDELESEFGKEIAFLVDGVTKINKLNFSGDNESIIANHRKILVGLSEDVRVIIIKLADRLHNMRTLWIMPEKKQKQKAKETLDILTPIAHRLGMNAIKSELEDLSLRYYKPDIYFSIVEKLNQNKNERNQKIQEMQECVSNLLNNNNIKHQIKGRAKSIYSIYNKLDKGRKFSDIYDLYALRVYVDTEQECYQALGIIHSKYRPIPKRFKDYIAMPKTNMYQSLHTTVFGIDGYLFEIQIRTYAMDNVAENGIASHWSYKEKGSNVKASMQNDMEQKLQFFKSIIELKDEEETDEQFVNSVKEDVFKNTIYVFTPKGDVVELPAGSTPIDFAYRIHSGVGDKLVGAIVNGIIVSLDYELNDNDIVKINTNKNSLGPSKEWINIAKTNQAKNKIKAFFNKLDKEEYYKKGEIILNKELKKKNISYNDFFTTDNIGKVLNELKYKDTEELFLNVGNGKNTAVQIINIVKGNTKSKEELIIEKVNTNQNIKTIVKNDIIVEGIDDIKVNIASCCKPIPGDRIVGYVTKGNGITVHRMVCPNNEENDEARYVDVKWNDAINKKYPTNLLIHAMDDKDILLNIISKTSNSTITVQTINNLSSSGNFIYELTVLVENKTNLMKFIDDVKTISNVLNVERMIK